MSLKLFQNTEFGNLEIFIDDNGKEWFPATECAERLGYRDPHQAIRKNCLEEGWSIRPVPTPGGTQDKKYITEGNLMRLITKSKLPTAVRFERWVFDEVLPSIRRNGAYMTPDTLEKALLNPGFLYRLAGKLKDEHEARLKAEAVQITNSAINKYNRKKTHLSNNHLS